MRKSIIQEIIAKPCTPFGRTLDLTADERTELRDAMEQAGAGWSMLYQRMTYRGFDTWELSGINHCMSDFWQTTRIDPEDTNVPKDLNVLNDIPPLSSFWQRLIEQGHHVGFIKYMEAHGMSRNTTIKRFSEPDFKPWELLGIAHILHSLEKSNSPH